MKVSNSYVVWVALLCVSAALCCAQQANSTWRSSVTFERQRNTEQFALAENGHALPILVSPDNPQAVLAAAEAFSSDVERVSGGRMRILKALPAHPPTELVIAGVIGHSAAIDRLRQNGKIQTASIEGKWESALTTVVLDPMPGVRKALVVTGSDRRGVAFALFTLSRQMGVSPWNWWADVPVKPHRAVYVDAASHLQGEPSVRYRGIFLNDEDWGLRPWAAKTMDPVTGNIGPNTYARVFELLLRLHANTLWPAMHPGTLAFNALSENARLADRWGIVMGSSHSEALLRNNVGEWNEKRDGPWNYQTNRAPIDKYWETRLQENGRYENFYTVGMRGVHDSGLEASGSIADKASLVEQVMKSQRVLLRKHVDEKVETIPQVIWLYKESLELYRAGMRVPDDVTLGWTDDNYGYIRQLPTVTEQRRTGGSGVYYHVSYWGFPHDYLWLCTTPPALIREEMTKAYDHQARRYWILNVGDLKPAEMDIDYFMQLAWDEPRMAQVDQMSFLRQWSAEQFPAAQAESIANVMQQYYQLNFVRKPEFMGFNGYNDAIRRTDFNPLAWGDQNKQRELAWQQLSEQTRFLQKAIPPAYQDAYFELVAYPVLAAAAQNEKFLAMDRSYLQASLHHEDTMRQEAQRSQDAYLRIQSLTEQYNALAGGKWNGMMSASPRDRQVFAMPTPPSEQNALIDLPASWKAATHEIEAASSTGKSTQFVERQKSVSINAQHFLRKQDGHDAEWTILRDLGTSGASVVYGAPGLLANRANDNEQPGINSPWLEYEFQTTSHGKATLTLYMLPTFPIDAQHKLRFAVALDGQAPQQIDFAGMGEWKENVAPAWETNVLRNAGKLAVALGEIDAGRHTVRFFYQDPGVVLEHLTITFPDAIPGYPVPPETTLIALHP
jgi:hypothetical protein